MFKKSIAALFASMITFVALAFCFFSVAADGTGDTVVRFRTDGTEGSFVTEESSSSSGNDPKIVIYGDDDQGIGSQRANIRLFDAGAYAVYSFDLDDGVTTAYLSIVGGSFTVSYQAGSADYEQLEKQTVGMPYGIACYRLDETNALSAEDNAFKIKLTNDEGGQIRLFMISVASAPVVSEALEFEGNTLEALSYVVDSDSSGVYFGGAEDKGMVYLKPEKSITYAFNIDGEAMNKVAFIAGLDTVNAIGNDPKVEYSINGADFTDYVNGTSIDVPDSAIYLKITNGSGARDLMLMNLSMNGGLVVGTGINSNTAVPVDETESYFQVGTDAETAHMFGASSDFQTEFNATHGGLTKDGHEGGYSESLPDNARKLTAGEYLVYDFDLADGIKSGKLKIHAGAGLTVKVSADCGDSYETLTAVGAPGGRGMYIFDLTENDALKNEENTFRLLIQASGENYVFAVSVHEDADEIYSCGVSLKAWSQGGLRNLVATDNVHTYYGNAMYPSYYFKTTDSYAIFKVKFDESVASIIFYVNQCANVKVELSGNGTDYTVVLENLLGGAGETPYNTFDASAYLTDNATVWLKMSGNSGGGFVFDCGFSVDMPEASSAVIGMDNIQNSLYSVSNSSSGVGQLYAAALNGEPVFKLAGEAVFRLDLNDDAIGIVLTLGGKGDQQAELSVSKDGETFTVIGIAGKEEKSFLDYSVVKNNPDNIVYVKLSSSEYFTQGFSFTTEGIEPEGDKSKPYDDADVSFNYDEEVPDASSYPKHELTAPEIPDGESVSGGCGGSLNGKAALFAALLAGLASLSVIRKKRGGKL